MNDETYHFECPYCGKNMMIGIDLLPGEKQELIYDCETCCRPIVIRFRTTENGVEDFHAATESE